MCLAAPMQLMAIDGAEGAAEVDGVRYAVRLDLIEGATLGDFVLVHAGYAIQLIDAEAARETLDLLAELRAVADGPDE